MNTVQLKIERKALVEEKQSIIKANLDMRVKAREISWLDTQIGMIDVRLARMIEGGKSDAVVIFETREKMRMLRVYQKTAPIAEYVSIDAELEVLAIALRQARQAVNADNYLDVVTAMTGLLPE